MAVSVALVLGRFAVARWLVPLGLREAHNANTAVMFGALYVMYGLIVGFSTYFVAYQYDTAAQKSAQDETGSVAEIPLGGSFPGTERREVQDLAEFYARTVLDEGCP